MNPYKKKLLETPMNQLKFLGEFFTKSFELDCKNQKYKDYVIPKLYDFIKLNNFLKYDYDEFKVSEYLEYYPFCKKSKKWEMLKKFLIENDFTTDDWAMLVPRKFEHGKKTDDLLALSKNQILGLPITIVCPGKSTKGIDDNITVANILSDGNFFYCKKATALVIKRRLETLGFDKNDGFIMKLRNSRNRSFYYKQLSSKGFTPEDSNTLIDLALRAGWIYLE
jgi:hypothetical protein